MDDDSGDSDTGYGSTHDTEEEKSPTSPTAPWDATFPTLKPPSSLPDIMSDDSLEAEDDLLTEILGDMSWDATFPTLKPPSSLLDIMSDDSLEAEDDLLTEVLGEYVQGSYAVPAYDFGGLPPLDEKLHLTYTVTYNVKTVLGGFINVIISLVSPFAEIQDMSFRPDGDGFSVYLGFASEREAYRAGLAMPWWVSRTRRWYTYLAASSWL